MFESQAKNMNRLLRAIGSGLLIALLAAPMHSFTQREHLLAIFTLPYLFAAAQRLEQLSQSLGK